MARKFIDPTAFSDPKDGVDLFSNAIRQSLEFDAMGGPEFIAKVLSTPQKLSLAQANALKLGAGGVPGPISLWAEGWDFLKSFFSSDEEESRDAERARAKNRQIESKFMYTGRIEEIHGALLPDPSCNLDLQGNPISDPYLLSLHTSFISTSEETGEYPVVGDLVRVRLNKGPYGFELETGTHIEVYESMEAFQSAMAAPDCTSINDLFDSEEDEGLTLSDYENLEGVESTGPADSRDLNTLDSNFKEKIETLITALEARGFQTTVFTAFRSIETQLDKYNKKLSKVKYGYHNFVTSGGAAASQAVDLALKGVGWGGDANSDSHKQATAYFKALGEEANKLGLTWGGDWSQSEKIWADEGIGWDPAHVELTVSPGQTIAQAQASATTAGYSVT